MEGEKHDHGLIIGFYNVRVNQQEKRALFQARLTGLIKIQRLSQKETAEITFVP